MSRIHEALKKAELDRGAAAPVETSGSPFLSHNGDNAAAERPASPTRPQVNVPLGQDRDSSSSVATSTLPETKEAPADHEDEVLELTDIQERCSHPNWDVDHAASVFANVARTVDGAEQFRTLRSRLYQMRNEHPLRTILITSALPGEGKTFVTSNLGQAIVRQNDRRVLIVDGDLRHSSVHARFGAPSSPGLSDFLRNDADLLSVIQQGSQANLFLIPGGTAVANPSELLANGRLKVLIESAAGAFDWILIDSPPCLPVADANILADACDGVLLVVRARSTTSQVAEKANKELQGRNVVGVVMNGVEKSVLGYHSRYYARDYVDFQRE